MRSQRLSQDTGAIDRIVESLEGSRNLLCEGGDEFVVGDVAGEGCDLGVWVDVEDGVAGLEE